MEEYYFIVFFYFVILGNIGIGTMFLSKAKPFREWHWYEIVFTYAIGGLSILFWVIVSEYRKYQLRLEK